MAGGKNWGKSRGPVQSRSGNILGKATGKTQLGSAQRLALTKSHRSSGGSSSDGRLGSAGSGGRLATDMMQCVWFGLVEQGERKDSIVF